MSVKAQAFSMLFKFLENGLSTWEWDSLSSEKMMAVSWKVKTHKEKTVRWLTNIGELDQPNEENDTFYIKVMSSFSC